MATGFSEEKKKPSGCSRTPQPLPKIFLFPEGPPASPSPLGPLSLPDTTCRYLIVAGGEKFYY